MTAEIRTDYDCETNGLPAERWDEAVFKIGDEEIVREASVAEDIRVSMMVDKKTTWRGTLKDLRQSIKSTI
jgi:hypothetical protein